MGIRKPIPGDDQPRYGLRLSDKSELASRYRTIREYAGVSKASQRRLLSLANVPTLPTYTNHRQSAAGIVGGANTSGRFVVRPLQHRGGLGYRITDRIDDFIEGKEYISELYPKTHEYRVIFCFGTPIITLYKRVPDTADRDGPWNHACGSTFVTVNDINNNRLRHTDVYDRLKEFDVIKHAHLCAADIMLGQERGNYAVCELNFCPSITIATNLERVRAHVASLLHG